MGCGEHPPPGAEDAGFGMAAWGVCALPGLPPRRMRPRAPRFVFVLQRDMGLPPLILAWVEI
jgi:hypothetical protein